MTKHNEDILNFLNDYMKVSKPGYAVLLKGSWGCGKTYFIKDWIKALKTKKNDKLKHGGVAMRRYVKRLRKKNWRYLCSKKCGAA